MTSNGTVSMVVLSVNIVSHGTANGHEFSPRGNGNKPSAWHNGLKYLGNGYT